ncbi:MAG: RNA polymerase sigma factor [Paludibacteraceae bacterium]
MILGNTTYSSLNEIIDGCLRNERLAQQRLYELYATRMTGICLRYVGDKEIALDLMHDGFLKVFANLKQYSRQGAFESWLRKIFVNVSLEYLRKHDVLRSYDDIDDIQFQMTDDTETIIEKMSADEIVKLINELPAGFRTVFNMYAIEGYSHAEIAKQLGINEASSRSQFSRARAVLQNKIRRNNSA